MKKYFPRIIDDQINRYLNIMGAIAIVGPKWCGKTTTAKQHANSVLKLESNKTDYYLQIAEFNPFGLIDGDKPRLIDEWQIIPIIWDIVRNSVDELDTKGNYILTGSTVVDDTNIMHSGAGRIHRMVMMPMSLYESGDSNGKISLRDLFENPEKDIDGIVSDLSFEDLIFVICRGGWPDILNIKNKEDQLLIAESYVDVICNGDMSTIDNVKRDPEIAKQILRSYSRNMSTLASDKAIMKDIHANYENISNKTYYSYIKAFKRLFVISNVRSWSPNIRSATSMRKTSKKEFIDPSIAVASLNLTPDKLLNDFNTLGFIFETLCIRDLRVYLTAIGGNVYYYHDRYDLEADCVLVLDSGKYALIEFKLGTKEIDKGARNLLKLRNLIEKRIEEGETHIHEPSFLAVVTGSDMAYTRSDGVKVIPVSCLRD